MFGLTISWEMTMPILIAYRRRGAVCWSHHFRVRAGEWKSLYRQARMYRNSFEYARIVRGDYISVL